MASNAAAAKKQKEAEEKKLKAAAAEKLKAQQNNQADAAETDPQMDTATKSIERPTGEIFNTRSPRVFAAVCPRNPGHQATRVYKTKGRTRYCVCDDCGNTWKQVGEAADPLGEYCRDLAGQLEKLAEEPTTLDGQDFVCLNIAEVLGIVEDVRLLLG